MAVVGCTHPHPPSSSPLFGGRMSAIRAVSHSVAEIASSQKPLLAMTIPEELPNNPMQSPLRRAFLFHLLLNIFLSLSFAFPASAILNHYLPTDGFSLARGIWLWAGITLTTTILTAVFIPWWANWLAQKDAEREANRNRSKSG